MQTVPREPAAWEWPVRRDQLIAARRSAGIALPVNMTLSVACALVAWHSGHSVAALLWLTVSSVVNGGRGLLHLSFGSRHRGRALDQMPQRDVERELGLLWKVTLLSGIVWASVPALCGLYTTSQSTFFLVVGCGITAGAVSHGGAYARIPIAFITPPVLSAIAALSYVGGFDRQMLAATMLLYLAALVLTTRRAERAFRIASRMTHRAIAMNAALETANARSRDIADDMRHRADHDQLTGLLNRAGFLREASVRLAAATAPSCLMLLDLDGFKAINDAFGHQVGDEILVEVADRLRTALSSGMLISRWGGDEFAVLYPADAATAAPTAIADRFIAAVAAPYIAFGSTTRIGLSIGIEISDTIDMSERLSCADLALYAAKAAGRNRHHLFDDQLRTQINVRRDVERDLPLALADGSIELWFQPIFGEAGTAVCGLEALIRWHHPIYGWTVPAELMATAAKAGFARPLMALILDRVCAMIEGLNAAGLGHVTVAMNLSPREMSQLPVDDLILAALGARNLSPSSLEVEITEETALDILSTERKIARLSDAGIRIAIDDFGVGYSSLSSLRRLRVDRIKIDRCFVSGLALSDDDQLVVKTVLTLGQSLGIDVVAEGVESLDDLRTLRALGCQFMQGYHLGRPMPAEQCLDAISTVSSRGGSPIVDGGRRLAS